MPTQVCPRPEVWEDCWIRSEMPKVDVTDQPAHGGHEGENARVDENRCADEHVLHTIRTQRGLQLTLKCARLQLSLQENGQTAPSTSRFIPPPPPHPPPSAPSYASSPGTRESHTSDRPWLSRLPGSSPAGMSGTGILKTFRTASMRRASLLPALVTDPHYAWNR
jgi:hypothetical protein